MQLAHFLNVDAQPASGIFSTALEGALHCAAAERSRRKCSHKRPRAAPSSAIDLLRIELPAVASAVLETLSPALNTATHMRRTWRNADSMGQICDRDLAAGSRTLALALSELPRAMHAAAARGHFSATPPEWVLDMRERSACFRLLDLLPHERDVKRVAIVADSAADESGLYFGHLLDIKLWVPGRAQLAPVPQHYRSSVEHAAALLAHSPQLKALTVCGVDARALGTPIQRWAELVQLTSLELYVTSRGALYGYGLDGPYAPVRGSCGATIRSPHRSPRCRACSACASLERHTSSTVRKMTVTKTTMRLPPSGPSCLAD